MSALLYGLLSDKLDEIAALYKVRPRITLIVRMPGKPDECAFLSDDAWPDAVATVERLYRDPGAFKAGPPEPPPDAAPAQTAPLPKADTDDGHYEMGLRIQIAQARGDIPSDGDMDPEWAAWAQRLLDDATAYRESQPAPLVGITETAPVTEPQWAHLAAKPDPVSAQPAPAVTLTRDEALAAGLPIHPEAVGVRLYAGAQLTQTAPHPFAEPFERVWSNPADAAYDAQPAPLEEAVREAAEALRVHLNPPWAMTEDELRAAGLSGMATLVRLSKELLAALDARKGESRG